MLWVWLVSDRTSGVVHHFIIPLVPSIPLGLFPDSEFLNCSRVGSTFPVMSEDGGVEQTRGQRQTGRNDLPGKGERVA